MPSIVLFLAGPDYEDLELHYPKLRLEEAGWDVKIAGLGEDRYYGKHGYPCDVDGPVGDFPASELAGIVVPGGWAPDRLRRAPEVLALVRALHARKKLVGSICHGPSVLISAGIVRGRRMTSSAGIRDDLVNAGADWVQAPVVVDEHLVSAQVPKDLPAFGLALVNFLDTWRAS